MKTECKLRDRNAALPGANTHGQLVAEVACERFAHSGQTHVLAQQCSHLKIELVERDDAVEPVLSREIADGVQNLHRSKVLRHGDELGDGLTRPVGVLELVDREQDNVDTETGGLFEKRLSLFVGADTENRGVLSVVGHASSVVNRSHFLYRSIGA